MSVIVLFESHDVCVVCACEKWYVLWYALQHTGFVCDGRKTNLTTNRNDLYMLYNQSNRLASYFWAFKSSVTATCQSSNSVIIHHCQFNILQRCEQFARNQIRVNYDRCMRLSIIILELDRRNDLYTHAVSCKFLFDARQFMCIGNFFGSWNYRTSILMTCSLCWSQNSIFANSCCTPLHRILWPIYMRCATFTFLCEEVFESAHNVFILDASVDDISTRFQPVSASHAHDEKKKRHKNALHLTFAFKLFQIELVHRSFVLRID